jgi:hypothetical protein
MKRYPELGETKVPRVPDERYSALVETKAHLTQSRLRKVAIQSQR